MEDISSSGLSYSPAGTVPLPAIRIFIMVFSSVFSYRLGAYSPKSSPIIPSTIARQRGRWNGPLNVEPFVEGSVGLPSRRR